MRNVQSNSEKKLNQAIEQKCFDLMKYVIRLNHREKDEDKKRDETSEEINKKFGDLITTSILNKLNKKYLKYPELLKSLNIPEEKASDDNTIIEVLKNSLAKGEGSSLRKCNEFNSAFQSWDNNISNSLQDYNRRFNEDRSFISQQLNKEEPLIGVTGKHILFAVSGGVFSLATYNYMLNETYLVQDILKYGALIMTALATCMILWNKTIAQKSNEEIKLESILGINEVQKSFNQCMEKFTKAFEEKKYNSKIEKYTEEENEEKIGKWKRRLEEFTENKSPITTVF